jgi:hypothetical protein
VRLLPCSIQFAFAVGPRCLDRRHNEIDGLARPCWIRIERGEQRIEQRRLLLRRGRAGLIDRVLVSLRQAVLNAGQRLIEDVGEWRILRGRFDAAGQIGVDPAVCEFVEKGVDCLGPARCMGNCRAIPPGMRPAATCLARSPGRMPRWHAALLFSRTRR